MNPPGSKHDLSRGPIRCVVTLPEPLPADKFGALAELAGAVEQCAAVLSALNKAGPKP